MDGLPDPEYIASAEWVAGKLREWGIKPSGTMEVISSGSIFLLQRLMILAAWFKHTSVRRISNQKEL